MKEPKGETPATRELKELLAKGGRIKADNCNMCGQRFPQLSKWATQRRWLLKHSKCRLPSPHAGAGLTPEKIEEMKNPPAEFFKQDS